jgi:hypothetical protein
MHRLHQLYKLLKGSLSGFSGKDLIIFLFFLCLSGVFWLMETLNETYEVEIPVAVRLYGVPKNVVLTSEMSDTVRVTVRDKGFVILGYKTYNPLRPIKISFAAYANKDTGTGQVPVADMQKLVRQQLVGSSAITAIKAESLDFYFNYGRNRKFHIRLIGHIVPGGNYYLSHVQLSPDLVTVYASEETLSKLLAVETERLDVTNFEDTVSRIVRLKPIAGAKIVPNTIKVTLFPDVLTEGSVDVPISAINKPESLTIRTFPRSVTVRYSVGANAYRQVRASDFSVFIDYNEIASHPSDKCNIYLHNNSHFARNASLEIKQVDYLIEQQ